MQPFPTPSSALRECPPAAPRAGFLSMLWAQALAVSRVHVRIVYDSPWDRSNDKSRS
jgi:hypothetical protein